MNYPIMTHNLWVSHCTIRIFESVDNRLNEIELTLLDLEVGSKSDYDDPPVMPVDYSFESNATDLTNLTNSFTGKFRVEYFE